MSFTPPGNRLANASGQKHLVVAARYNETLVEQLLTRFVDTLAAAGVAKSDIDVFRVPGSNEIPCGVLLMAEAGNYDCCTGLGVIIQGETNHAEIVARQSSEGLMRAMFETRVPTINGVVVAGTEAEAASRCGPEVDRGAEFAYAAIEMAGMKQSVNTTP